MFRLFYLFVGAILYILFIPFVYIFSFKSKYKTSIPARFLLKNNPPFQKADIHFHACSYGEAKAIKPLVESLNKYKLNFSAITQTGFSVLQEYSKSVRYLPFEIFLPRWYVKQKALVVVEAELWYMLFAAAKQKGAKTFLINARVSSRSFPKYMRFKWFYKRIFKNIDSIYAQSYDDAKRLVKLGAKDIKVSGNIKFLNIQKPSKEYIKKYPVVVTAASTHDGEEEGIVLAFLKLRDIENAQLIVVPRHPERFEKVAQMLQKIARNHNLSYERFSQTKRFASDIVLVDTMGELINVYNISDVVILGGAFSEIGGHNALEAAQFNTKIISGPHYFNQIDIFNAIKGIKITPLNDLDEVLVNYKKLESTKLETRATIEEIVEEIKSVL